VTPSNGEAGYVLRRLIRRSIREADKLGIKEAVLAEVAEGFGDAYADHYPIVKQNHDFIRDELAKEEEQFRKALTQGLREFEKFIASNTLDADAVFTLFTSYGFPIEMTEELAKERGVTYDVNAVGAKLKEHQETSRAGGAQRFAGGLADHAEQTVRYHTTHHILLKALQIVLGKDVHQRGSNITSERLRIDFAHGAKMTPEQISEAEKIVNDVIAQELPVTRTVMKQEDAEKLGAEHEFGVKYPEMVSVYSVGPKDATEEDPKFAEAFSIEYCGGPHVTNTREIGEGGKKFKIKKEEASSAGVRRIKAVVE
jgi:alanyl-tRNA synthetase